MAKKEKEPKDHSKGLGGWQNTGCGLLALLGLLAILLIGAATWK